MIRNKDLLIDELNFDYCHFCNKRHKTDDMVAYYPEWPEMERVEYKCESCCNREYKYFMGEM